MAILVIDATGYRSETLLTLRGDVVGITNANGETVKFEIDPLGRKVPKPKAGQAAAATVAGLGAGGA